MSVDRVKDGWTETDGVDGSCWAGYQVRWRVEPPLRLWGGPRQVRSWMKERYLLLGTLKRAFPCSWCSGQPIRRTVPFRAAPPVPTLVKETGRIQYYCTSPCVAPVSEWVVALPMPAWAACAACRGGGGGRTSAASACSHWAASGGDRRPAAGHRGTRNLDGLVSQRPAQRSNLPSAGGGPVA